MGKPKARARAAAQAAGTAGKRGAALLAAAAVGDCGAIERLKDEGGLDINALVETVPRWDSAAMRAAAIAGTSTWPIPVPTFAIPVMVPRRRTNQRAMVESVTTSWVL